MVSRGINLFDTADSYGTGRLNGRSEQLLGRFTRWGCGRVAGIASGGAPGWQRLKSASGAPALPAAPLLPAAACRSPPMVLSPLASPNNREYPGSDAVRHNIHIATKLAAYPCLSHHPAAFHPLPSTPKGVSRQRHCQRQHPHRHQASRLPLARDALQYCGGLQGLAAAAGRRVAERGAAALERGQVRAPAGVGALVSGWRGLSCAQAEAANFAPFDRRGGRRGGRPGERRGPGVPCLGAESLASRCSAANPWGSTQPFGLGPTHYLALAGAGWPTATSRVWSLPPPSISPASPAPHNWHGPPTHYRALAGTASRTATSRGWSGRWASATTGARPAASKQDGSARLPTCPYSCPQFPAPAGFAKAPAALTKTAARAARSGAALRASAAGSHLPQDCF